VWYEYRDKKNKKEKAVYLKEGKCQAKRGRMPDAVSLSEGN